MKTLLICGDSFSADWSIVANQQGWVNYLADDFKVTNLSQAGCSEFKILKQLQSVNVNAFDNVIVSHTSPYRLYVRHHPIHDKNPLHKNSCLIYEDIKAHAKTNATLLPITLYMEQYFDLEYAEHIHNLLIKEIESICPVNTLHVSHVNWENLYCCKNWLNFKEIFQKHRGKVNHYNEKGNRLIYRIVKNNL